MCAHSCGCVWLSRRVCDCHCVVFAGWRHTRKFACITSMVVLVAWLGCVLRGVWGWWIHRFCVTKVLLCWCTVGCLGQHWLFLLGPAYTGDLLWLFVCGVVLCENCIVDASIFLFCVLVLFTLIVCVSVCFVTGVWWMPWHAEPMKDV